MTSATVRRRQQARKEALRRKEKVDAAARRRDERETDLVTDFLVGGQERHAAELFMGKATDALISELKVPFERAAELLGADVAELKRLRRLAVDSRRARSSESSDTDSSTPPQDEHGGSANNGEVELLDPSGARSVVENATASS